MKAKEGIEIGELIAKGFISGIKEGEAKAKYNLTYTEAVEAIMNNYPPEQYSILREALNMAIDLMTDKARKEAEENEA